MGYNPKDPNSQFINHEMQDALRGLNELTFIGFFISAPELIDDGDGEILKKTSTKITRDVLISLVLGVGLNVQLKRVPKLNFLSWNKYLRFMCRIPILIAPFGLFYKSLKTECDKLGSLHHKYFRRITAFQRTGDLRYLDPQLKMMQRM